MPGGPRLVRVACVGVCKSRGDKLIVAMRASVWELCRLVVREVA